jgi:ribosomal protein S18 acetylase RimI-like enzyme
MTSASTHLRAPASSDYAIIASWIADAAAAHRWAGPFLPFPFSAADLPVLLAGPGNGETNHCLADDSPGPLGFGQHWTSQPGTVHLARLIVAPHVRGQGMGRRLCQHLIAAALQSTDARTVTLRAYRDNLAAVRLYESLGFTEMIGESTPDILFMKMPV